MIYGSAAGPRRRSWGLGRKLSAGFALVTALSTALGFLAINRMHVVNHTDAAISENYLPSLGVVGNLGLAIEDMRRAQARLALSTAGSASAQQSLLSAHAAAAQAVKLRREYEPMTDPGVERDRWTTIYDQMWPTVNATTDQLAQLKSSGQDKQVVSAYVDQAKQFTTVLDFLRWDLKYNGDHGAQAASWSRHVYAEAWWMILGGLTVVLALSVATALFLIRHISTPLARMTGAMRRLADHEMSTEIPYADRADEVGAMAAAVQTFKEKMLRADQMSAERQVAREAQTQRSADLVTSFQERIGGTVSIIASAATKMEATAQSLTATATETDNQANAASNAAGLSSIAVQTVSAASQQLSASISEINRQVASSATLTGNAVITVKQTDETVKALAENASQIGHVVELINGIASQTNLLALNATIEAARAGEAGKGFAVVASEVKSLAHKTATATTEIGGQIARVQQAAAEAVAAMRHIAAMIEEVGAITTAIAAAVEEQGAATAEIARNVQQTAETTDEVTTNIVGVSRSVSSTGAAAAEVLGAAGDLSRQADGLASEVEQFVAAVRAA